MKYSGLAALVISLIVGAFAFTNSGTTVVNTTETHPVGSLPSSEISSDTYVVGGSTFVARKANFLRTATTTPCPIPVPVGTSTLISYGMRVGVGTSTALVYDISTSSTQFATTTNFNWAQSRAIASGALDAFAYGINSTSTGAFGAAVVLISPSATAPTFINVKFGNVTGGFGPLLGGSCQALFQMIM